MKEMEIIKYKEIGGDRQVKTRTEIHRLILIIRENDK